MRKCLSLSILEPTKAKEKLLRDAYISLLGMVKEALGFLGEVKSQAELHKKTYYLFKYDAASQLIIKAASYAWSIRKTINGDTCRCVIRFDERLFSFKETKRGNPVLSIIFNRRRIGLPIKQDGAYKRLQEHLKEGWKVTSIIMKQDLSFRIILSKELPEPIIRPKWMGVDINSSKIAASIIGGGRVLKQIYFGQDVFAKQFRFEERRAKLQSYRDEGSSRAGLKLKKLSGKQRSYVRTRIWQIANEIVKLAKGLNSNIAIERLRYLRKRKGEWSKKSAHKVNRIPYGFFRHALKRVAEREGIMVIEVKSSYTNQTCSRCWYIENENWRGYVYFKCVKCGYEANRDRVASLNIALRAAPKAGVPKCYFWSQLAEGEASLSKLVLKDEGHRWHQTTPSFKPTDLSVVADCESNIWDKISAPF